LSEHPDGQAETESQAFIQGKIGSEIRAEVQADREVQNGFQISDGLKVSDSLKV
jgi:hypothetical protein